MAKLFVLNLFSISAQLHPSVFYQDPSPKLVTTPISTAMSLFSFFIFLQLFAGIFALNWRLTAISANARRESILECWELCTPISISSTPGISGAALQALGPITSASAATLPPYYDAGLHKAPAAQ